MSFINSPHPTRFLHITFYLYAMDDSLPSSEFCLTIADCYAGIRLDKFLASQQELAHLSRSRLQGLNLGGQIKVDGENRKTGYRLKAGETVTIVVPPPTEVSLTPIHVDFGVLFEDADIIVINKPAGLVVHPAPGHADKTLVHGLLYHCGDLSGIGGEIRPGIVHRLDKDTSGVLVVAKNDQAHQHLARQFQQRTVKKMYHAIVAGHPAKDEDVIQTLLGRHPVQRKKMAVLKQDGRTAVTRYRVLSRSQSLSFLEVIIETGRTHQIRVHFAFVGCPVLADPIYGGKKTSVVPAPRLCLHASRLQIMHPVSNEEMVFHAPLADDIANVLTEHDFSSEIP